MKKILITGGQGFFGSRFTKIWDKNYEISNLSSKELDVTNIVNIEAIFKKIKPDYVIHAAGITSQEFCKNNPEIAYKVNVEGAFKVAKMCSKYNSKLLFISTEQIYSGNKETGPYSEEVIPHPNTIYGNNKLEVEKSLDKYCKNTWIVRFSWLFGLDERNCRSSKNLLQSVLTAALRDKPLKVSPYDYRNMSYVYDMCKRVEQIFYLPYGTYNLGSRNDLSSYDLAIYILKLLSIDARRIKKLIVSDTTKYNENKIRDLRLDTNLAKQNGIVFDDTKTAIKKCLEEFFII